ncbi:MAG: hypothetical protein ACKO24_17405 [Leptolyngbyaceae cyanobacterium]
MAEAWEMVTALAPTSITGAGITRQPGSYLNPEMKNSQPTAVKSYSKTAESELATPKMSTNRDYLHNARKKFDGKLY